MNYRFLCLVGLILIAGATAAVWLWPRSRPAPPPEEPKPTPGLPWFEDVTTAAGITFRHFDSATPEHRIQETFGSGLGWIDYNADGWPDLFCVQAGPVVPPTDPTSLPTCRLYRNNGDGTFTDVTEQAGLAQRGFGFGCAVGDFDNDGFDDLVVTSIGKTTLYHNEPDGADGRRFVDVTAKAGIDNPHWGTSCAWGDIDGDGFLDLYICNYVEVNRPDDPLCRHEGTGIYIGCSPTAYPKTTHKLYRNNGNGTFTDISEVSGVAAAKLAPGLGVVMADFDGDGKIDIFVANDMHPQYLFHNQGGGKFIERAMASGCALDQHGNVISGMGVEAADLDGSGRLSLFVTNYQNEPNIVFSNKGDLRFQDWTYPSGLGAPSLKRLGFGTVFLDADLDGVLDVAVANGHVQRPAQELYGCSYAQEAQFFLGAGGGKYREVSDQVGKYFHERYVGRGLAYADFNNDGLPDLAFSNNAGPIGLLKNATATENGWARLELIGDGKRSNRNAIGSRLEIEAGGKKQVRFIHGGGSYLSASERRVLVGLASATKIDRLSVTWPSGRRQEFRDLPALRWWRFHEGEETPEEVKPGPARP
jgi:enediyne biosynthesis protein E4